jgi:hypothetical protein
VQQANLVQNEMFQLYSIKSSKWFLKNVQEEESRCNNYHEDGEQISMDHVKN